MKISPGPFLENWLLRCFMHVHSGSLAQSITFRCFMHSYFWNLTHSIAFEWFAHIHSWDLVRNPIFGDYLNGVDRQSKGPFIGRTRRMNDLRNRYAKYRRCFLLRRDQRTPDAAIGTEERPKEIKIDAVHLQLQIFQLVFLRGERNQKSNIKLCRIEEGYFYMRRRIGLAPTERPTVMNFWRIPATSMNGSEHVNKTIAFEHELIPICAVSHTAARW